MSDLRLTLPDGSVRMVPRGTTGRDVARSISEGLARNALAVKVNGEVRDLDRPIEEDASFAVLTWNDPEGKSTFWHSSAHLMAEALEALHPGVRFGIGPPIEHGFYYDVDLGGQQLTPEDLAALEAKMIELARRDVRYERREVSKAEAISYFQGKDDPYKLELFEGLADGQITFYSQGDFTDLCKGPHIPSTGAIKAAKLLSVAGAYWRGDSSRPQLTRLYAITFPKKSELDEFLRLREEAEKRDHRKLGRELELFLLTPAIGGGLPAWLPKGTVLRRTLEAFLRDEQRRRGYQEVITPHIGNLELYKTSGHYPYYADSQYPPMQVEDEQYLLKPMNCPHHHQIYASKPRSYRDLPVRLAEFGTVYRYEQSGELGGLSRVRGFTQDDAHLYCTHEQLKEEIKGVVDLTQFVFKTFGMDVTTRLSFRDDNASKYGGDLAYWERAQLEIQEVADEMGLDYFVGEGEAAFYGPKIDFIVRDALGRKWQLGTVQVDYVMPERFQLEYTGADGGKHRPVIIHRAPFGSMERFVSILIEHYAGNFPVWLAPVQVAVLPVSNAFDAYTKRVEAHLRDAGIRAEADLRSEKIGYKIRQAETQKVPVMLVVGANEAENGTVAVRRHGQGAQETATLEAFTEALRAEVNAQMGRS
ncbi:MAG TPA: threonine--tRNA ligase [Rhodothermales bacterium]|nr:threonine--tRNA ligase [Rhodothermales bacterium]